MARKNSTVAAILLLVALLGGALVYQVLMPRAPAAPAASEDGISVYFSPKGGCTEAIVEQLNKAQATILIQAYWFTSKPIAQALLDAHKRGVKITAIIDAERVGEQYSEATFLHNQGMAVFRDAQHQIAHNKIMLIDGATIITGSFNFTHQAEESNAENLLVIQGKPQLFAAYERNFQVHLGHSEKYAGR